MDVNFLNSLLTVSIPLLTKAFLLREEFPFWLQHSKNHHLYGNYKYDIDKQFVALMAMGEDSSYPSFLKAYQDDNLYRDSTMTDRYGKSSRAFFTYAETSPSEEQLAYYFGATK